MFTHTFTQEDMGSLGWPREIMKDVYIAYYQWVKENKPVLEFSYDREITVQEYNKIMEN